MIGITTTAGAPVREETWTRWTAVAYAAGVVLAVAIGYYLFRTPLQVTDDLVNLLEIRGATLWQVLVSQFTQRGYLRPFLWANLRVVYALANGHYFAAFRAYHAAQVLLMVVLVVRLMRVRTVAQCAAALFALVVLVGLHTFAPLVREGYPINTFLSIVIYLLIAASLSASRGGWWADVAAAVLFVVAALTLESGLLVWVCVVGAWIVGFRGVSWRGIAAMTVLLAAYFFLRFGPLGVGSPALIERSTGYGFRVIDRADLVVRFGGHASWFYAYNVVSSVLTVLAAEPRAGVWEFTRALTQSRDVPPWMIINVVSCVVTSIVVLAFGIRAAVRWLRGGLEYGDRLILLFFGVLAANAVISYPYTKDVIMSPAGVFYALAAYFAFEALLRSRAAGRLLVGIPLSLLFVGLSSLWVVRVVALEYNTRYTAFTNRTDWAGVRQWFDSQPADLKTGDAPQFIFDLENQMLHMQLPNPYFMDHSAEPYFDQH